MKKLLLAVFILGSLISSLPLDVYADVSVKGYYRKDGTYVRPHMRSDPDSSVNNNWSTEGNVNPYTGKAGTKPRVDEGNAASPEEINTIVKSVDRKSVSSVQSEVRKVEAKYRKNPHGFRERLIPQIQSYNGVTYEVAAKEVYSLLPDIK